MTSTRTLEPTRGVDRHGRHPRGDVGGRRASTRSRSAEMPLEDPARRPSSRRTTTDSIAGLVARNDIPKQPDHHRRASSWIRPSSPRRSFRDSDPVRPWSPSRSNVEHRPGRRWLPPARRPGEHASSTTRTSTPATVAVRAERQGRRGRGRPDPREDPRHASVTVARWTPSSVRQDSDQSERYCTYQPSPLDISSSRSRSSPSAPVRRCSPARPVRPAPLR